MCVHTYDAITQFTGLSGVKKLCGVSDHNVSIRYKQNVRLILPMDETLQTLFMKLNQDVRKLRCKSLTKAIRDACKLQNMAETASRNGNTSHCNMKMDVHVHAPTQ